MIRFSVKHDGNDAGFVYADNAAAARKAARAAYKRVFPDRDPGGRVRVDANGTPVDGEAVEARHIVSQVYEGLRLLPGMEMPAEKLRNAMVLLETAVARDSVQAMVGGTSRLSAAARGAGGDALAEALEPVMESKVVPGPVVGQIRGVLEWVGLNTTDEERTKIELKIFQALYQNHLVDLLYSKGYTCNLYKASRHLTKKLVDANLLRVERFEGAGNIADFKQALKQYGTQDAAELSWSFVPATDEPEEVEMRRPLVLLGKRILQPALLMRGIPVADDEVVALDKALFECLDRLKLWQDGCGRLALPFFTEKQEQLFNRTETRINTTRKQMAQAAKAGDEVLPPDTARRDLVKFLIDQVHRIQDALVCLCPDTSLKEAYDELVFKDVVFRIAGAYLSQRFEINIDTAVVAGADSESLAGRSKKEKGGPKPRQESTRIHSVVVPCYTQDGTAIRPASVRLGVY